MVAEDYAMIKKERRRQLIHRAASGCLALFYIMAALFTGKGYFVVKFMLFLVLPLSAIWFPKELGSLKGVTFGRFSGPAVTESSPAPLVRFAGWILLLGPAWWFVITALLNK